MFYLNKGVFNAGLVYFFIIVERFPLKSLCFCVMLRRLDELQSLLVEERDKVANLSEQLQNEKSHRERELDEAKEKHQFQISDLQDKVFKLVGISGRCFFSVT